MSNQDQNDFHNWQFLRLGSSSRETVSIEGMESHRLHARPKEGKATW